MNVILIEELNLLATWRRTSWQINALLEVIFDVASAL